MAEMNNQKVVDGTFEEVNEEKYDEIAKYADIVPEELANIFYADDAKIAEIFKVNTEE